MELAIVALVVFGLANQTSAQSLAGAANHTLGIRPDGTVAAWGANGQMQVSGASSITAATAVSGGFFYSMALRSDGTVTAWGLDEDGVVSGASTVSGATAIAGGGYHSLALRSDGTVAAWGHDNLGQVSGASAVSGATAISAGTYHSLALRSDGTVAAWGYDDWGQVSGANSVTGAKAISAGGFHSLALRADGTVAAWGFNNHGQIAGASSVSSATAISSGEFHSLALRSNGTIAAWGRNDEGQVAGASSQTNVVYVAAGALHSYAVRSDGSIASWGSNGSGQRNTPIGFQLPTTVRWGSATNGDYLNSHLWNGRIPSTALSTAVFDNSGTYSIHFGNSARARGLDVMAGNLTFDLGIHHYQVETDVNVASGATLTINGTLTIAGSFNIAGAYQTNGATTVNRLNNTGTLNLGGIVNATDGVTNSGSIQLNYGNELLIGSSTSYQDGFAHLRVGRVGGASLTIIDGGTLYNNGFANIGGSANEAGSMAVSGAGSQWTNVFNIDVGVAGDALLEILDGARVISGSLGDSLGESSGYPTRIGDGASQSTGQVIVAGTGSTWEMASDLLIEGSTSRLNISDGAVVSNLNAQVDDAHVHVTGSDSHWNNSGELLMVQEAMLTIEAEGVVTNTHGRISGTALVNGNGSRWDNSGDLEVGRAGFSTGNLEVHGGAAVTSQNAFVGTGSEAYGEVNVSGFGSEWINSGNMVIGGSGAAYGSMSISDGGRVDSQNTSVVHGDVTVGSNGANLGATWLISNDLQLGTNRYSTLSVNNGADVIVGNRTSITPNGQVYMNGGRFEFGKMSLDSYHQVGRYGGSMEGLVEASGVHNMANLEPSFSNSSTDISQVRLSNTGILSGSGLVDVGLANQTTGQVRATANDWMRFGGAGNTNAGRITNLGGVIEFGGDMTNQSTGFITGRGAFIANNWVNQGSIAVSGTTDIIGNMDNRGGSLIVTSANATTTFYDSVINNGEIRTSGNGNSVFFEAVSGAGNYTGTGNVFFEGNVNPGNSPSVVNFGGNLTLGSASHTLFEIGGASLGEFDRLNIAGNFSILGSMSVVMWNDFQLTPGMSFMIADIAGNRSGMFSNFGEGALVGNFSGQNLFITYGAGSGNDIALFTAVPEPGALTLCLSLGLASLIRRRKGQC